MYSRLHDFANRRRRQRVALRQEQNVPRIFIVLFTAIIALSSLTACDSGKMDPIQNGGDAPGDIRN
jgi:hypothetical protein